MQNIIKSAAKLVFIALALTACAAFFLGILSEDNFMILATGAFSFYFAHKGETPTDYVGK